MWLREELISSQWGNAVQSRQTRLSSKISRGGLQWWLRLRNISEMTKWKMTDRKQPSTHILSKLKCYTQFHYLRLLFFWFPHLWGHWPQQTRALALSPITPYNPKQGFHTKESPTEAFYLTPIKALGGIQLRPENQTHSKHCLLHPAKSAQKRAVSFL